LIDRGKYEGPSRGALISAKQGAFCLDFRLLGKICGAKVIVELYSGKSISISCCTPVSVAMPDMEYNRGNWDGPRFDSLFKVQLGWQ
jgi:hypothetical protein